VVHPCSPRQLQVQRSMGDRPSEVAMQRGSRKVEHARRARLRHRHVHVDRVVREGYGYATLTMQIHVESQAGDEQGKLQ
jgi:hypothetical protein